jgi:6-phosphofructokinase 1
MGRNSGFLTAASSLAQKYPDDGPHLIYLPERVFKVEEFLKDVRDTYDRLGRCLIAVSEGIKDEKGQPIGTSLSNNVEKDSHGNILLAGNSSLADILSNLVKTKLNISRVRADTLGYPQRSFISSISDVDQREAREVGEKAAQFAIWNNIDGSITIQRMGFYSVDYKLVGLEKVAAKTKIMPPEFINNKGNGITDEFKFYLRPLVGSNLGVVHRLRAPMVEKILNK